MKDFFSFRRMLTPMLIQIIFWLGLIACIVSGIVTMFIDKEGVLRGLETLILGPIIVRITCELVILFFRINETLTDIKNKV